MIDSRGRPSPRAKWIRWFVPLMISVLPAAVYAQDRPSGYSVPSVKSAYPGEGLEMMVHIIGEVQKPGEYRVSDRTDLLELLSKSGGPTQFSRLSGITVRRTSSMRASASPTVGSPAVEIIPVNLDRIMRDKTVPPPVLQPGDVVFVPKNGWSRWKDVSAVARDLSVIAGAYFLYLRANKN